MPKDPNKVVQSSRRIIEHKLLTALGDSETVAILASKDDLNLMITALQGYHELVLKKLSLSERWTGAESMLVDLKQLRREAFGE